MSGWTYPYASGTDLTKIALTLAVGQEPDELLQRRIPLAISDTPFSMYELAPVRFSAERAYISIPGQIRQIQWQDKMLASPFVRDLYARVREGDCVDFPRNNVEKCGNIIAVSHDREAAIEVAQDAVSDIFITLEADNPRTEKYLNLIEDDDEAAFPPDAFGRLNNDEIEKIKSEITEIPSDAKTADFIPKVLQSAEYINKTDWNYNTIQTTAQKFDILRPKHPELDAKRFWNALTRGGIQAAVYVSDTTEKLGGK
jgi:hypothetical protein